jgi:hypothetical protein
MDTTSMMAQSIVNGARERLGNVDVEIEPVSEIPRSAERYSRAVVSRVPRP